MKLQLQTSEKMFELAKKIDADSMTSRKRLLADQWVEGAYPKYIQRSKGAYLWDVDENQYLDMMLAFGTVVLGHADPDVETAVRAELEKGVASAIHRTIRLELISLLSETVPGAEAVTLLKTGSDGTSAAVRLARIFTQRTGVIRWGYHGWHDWCCPRDAGIPRAAREGVSSFKYNDLSSLKAAFEARKDEIACLIMMPFELEEPENDFLKEAKAIAHHYKALFILDEVRSGFRVALGGAQEKYGVTADLSVFSKAMANGFEISAVTGRAEILKGLAHTHVSSTFFNNSLSMAAACATIRKLRSSDALAKIEFLGKSFLSGLERLIQFHGVPAKAVGVPSMPFLEFLCEDPSEKERLRNHFYREVTAQGVILFPAHHWFLCASMNEADVRKALQAIEKGFQSLKAL